MSFLHEWLLGISACALLVSFAEQLPLTDAMRKIVRFTGGLLLILSILQPISGAELDGLSFDLAGYEEAVEALKTELAGERERALSDGIAEQTQAYIEDKASALGLRLRAVVDTECTDGVPLPKHVTLYGEKNAELSEWIAEQLGIAKENQIWKEPE